MNHKMHEEIKMTNNSRFALEKIIFLSNICVYLLCKAASEYPKIKSVALFVGVWKLFIRRLIGNEI